MSDNERRASDALAALGAGGYGCPVDLICDLLHLSVRQGRETTDTINSAVSAYNRESGGDVEPISILRLELQKQHATLCRGLHNANNAVAAMCHSVIGGHQYKNEVALKDALVLISNGISSAADQVNLVHHFARHIDRC